MILISAGLVLAAVVLLIAGFVLAKPFLIMWSIVVSVLSALFLVIGALLRRHELFPGGRAGATATPPDPTFGFPQPPHPSQAPVGAPPSPPRRQTFQQTATVPAPAAPRRPAARGISPDSIVLVIPGRKRYHVPGCRQLIGRDHEELTYEEAREEGFTPCTACLPDAALGGRQLPPAADPEPVTPHTAASPETQTVSAGSPAEPSEATRDLRPPAPVAAPKSAPAASTPTPESGPDQPGGWFAPKTPPADEPSSSGTAPADAASSDTAKPAPGAPKLADGSAAPGSAKSPADSAKPDVASDEPTDAETTNPHLRLPAMDPAPTPPSARDASKPPSTRAGGPGDTSKPAATRSEGPGEAPKPSTPSSGAAPKPAAEAGATPASAASRPPAPTKSASETPSQETTKREAPSKPAADSAKQGPGSAKRGAGSAQQGGDSAKRKAGSPPQSSGFAQQGPESAERGSGSAKAAPGGATARPEAPAADEARPTGKTPSGPRVAPYVGAPVSNGSAKPDAAQPKQASAESSRDTKGWPGKPQADSPGKPAKPQAEPAGKAATPAGDEETGEERLRPGTVKVIVGTRRYHSTACPLIRGAGDTGVETMSLAQAEAAGLTSCSVCQNDRESVS